MQLQKRMKDLQGKIAYSIKKVECKVYLKQFAKTKKMDGVVNEVIHIEDSQKVFQGAVSKKNTPASIKIESGHLEGYYFLINKTNDYVFYYNPQTSGVIVLGKTDCLVNTILKARNFLGSATKEYQVA